MTSQPPWPNWQDEPPQPPPPHPEHRLTILEQTVIRLQEMARWHIDSINQKILDQNAHIKEIREEHKQLYQHAMRIVLIAATGAGLVIFNLIWKSATAGSSF